MPQEGDIGFVKELISTKELKMDETNNMGQNLLMLSAIHGQYELVATAINLGTDLDKMDQQKMTALKYSQDKGHALCTICTLQLTLGPYLFPMRFSDFFECTDSLTLRNCSK